MRLSPTHPERSEAPGVLAILTRLAAAAASLSLLACGGAAPLLHPAHPLAQGDVRMGVGVSSQIARGDTDLAIKDAQNQRAGGVASSAAGDVVIEKGALAVAAVQPGVTPWLGGRVGLGHHSEAGITYTARDLRVDARYALESAHYALSFGLGGHGVLAGRDRSEPISGIDLNGVNGWGLDVPILAGWQSDSSLYSAWIGPRFAYEKLGGGIVLGETTAVDNEARAFSATRTSFGGVFGFRVGFRHLFVALEMNAAYRQIAGEMGGARHELSGLSLVPAGALQGEF